MKYCMRSAGAGHHQTADRCVVHCHRSLHSGTLGDTQLILAIHWDKKGQIYCFLLSKSISFLSVVKMLIPELFSRLTTPMTRVQLPRFNIPEQFRHRNNGIIVYGDMSTILTLPRARGFWSSCNSRYQIQSLLLTQVKTEEGPRYTVVQGGTFKLWAVTHCIIVSTF